MKPRCKMKDEIRTAVEAWCKDRDAAKLQYGPIASWDTSEITNMSSLFSNKVNFNGDISGWDVSSVLYMDGMLYGATSFNCDLSQWDVSNVTQMHSMLSGATSFNCDLSQWDLSKVRYMSHMLAGATSFTHQLGGAWSTSTATKYGMFMNCPGGSIVGKTKQADGTIV